MSSELSRVPRVVTVRVQRAEGLRIVPKSENKQKKLTYKWKVVFVGGKKKMATSSVWSPGGDPVWDYEVTFKLAALGEPIALLVTDSEDHHVGQVIIPTVTMLPRPANPNERPTDPSRLRKSELEPTKKVEHPFGSLYYWVWVEEYVIGDKLKSRTLSVLSLPSLKHNKTHASAADSLHYSGSVLGPDPTQIDPKESKRKSHLLKRKPTKDVFKSAADLSQRPSFSTSAKRQSTSSHEAALVFDRTDGANSQSTSDLPPHDHDGSVLGASSELTGSDLYRNDRNESLDLPRVKLPFEHSTSGGRRTSAMDAAFSRPESHRSPPTMDSINSPVPNSIGLEPALLNFQPTSCPTTGGVEVTVRCTGLTADVMRYASILVDGYVVPRQDWYLDDSRCMEDGGVVDLRILMPERPTGTCWIELETMNHGRLRCNQEFTYVQPMSAYEVPEIKGSLIPAAMRSESGEPSHLGRAGSQRSNLMVRDRRSERRTRLKPDPTPVHQTTEHLPEEHKIRDDFIRSEGQKSSAAGSVISQPLSFRDSGVESFPEASDIIGSQEPSDENLFSGIPLGQESSKLFQTKPDVGSPPKRRSEELAPIQSSDSSQNRLRPTEDLGVSPHLRDSFRSTASEQSKSVLDENIELENRGLRAMLTEANHLMDVMRRSTVDLEQQLSLKTKEVDRLSLELCSLRNRLLKDGAVKYLEISSVFS